MYDICWSCTTRDFKITEHLVNRIEATFIIWLDQKSIGERFTSVVLFCVSMCHVCVKEVKMQDVEVFHLKQKWTTLTRQCQNTITYPTFTSLPFSTKIQASFSWCGHLHLEIRMNMWHLPSLHWHLRKWRLWSCVLHPTPRHSVHEGDGETEGWWWNTNPTTPITRYQWGYI